MFDDSVAWVTAFPDHSDMMFRVNDQDSLTKYRYLVLGLLVLSLATLALTIWFVIDFAAELEILRDLIRDLPERDLPAANRLAEELRWQSRLTFLIILQVVLAGLAVILLWRAYQASQASLQDVKALAGDILNSMNQGIITCDNDALITSVNPRAIELLKLDGDAVGKSIRELTDRIDLQGFYHNATQGSEAYYQQELHFVGPEPKGWLSVHSQPLQNRDGAQIGHVIQLRDITRERHTANQIRRMERYMGLGSLAAGLHHEIKNPLAAVSLHVQILEERLANAGTDEETHELLNIIESELRRTTRVLESFRSFASTAKLDLRTVPLREMVHQQIELIRPQAEFRRVQVDECFAAEVPERLAVDPDQFPQVLANLLHNALEAMPSGGRLEVTVEPFEQDGDRWLMFSVADTGEGIPEEMQGQIFDAYFTTKGEGTGMGLAISDKIVRQHGGRIDVDSDGQGTTVRVVLPAIMP